MRSECCVLLRLGAICGLALAAWQTAGAAVTNDRVYLFGDIMSGPQDENATVGGVVGNNTRGETLDTVSQGNNPGDIDAQNLTPNSVSTGPLYAQVGTGALLRPGTAAADLGA